MMHMARKRGIRGRRFLGSDHGPQIETGGVYRSVWFLAARGELRRRELPLCPGTGGRN